MENKSNRIINYMKNHQIKSIVYISLIFTAFLALLIFLGTINVMIPLIFMITLMALGLIVGLATSIVLSVTG